MRRHAKANRLAAMRPLLVPLLVFATALAVRTAGRHDIPPFDDLYHAKRIAFTAAHFPDVLSFDPDRGFHGAFCPWPPFYDLAMGAAARAGVDVRWLPTILFSIFAAGMALLFAQGFGTPRVHASSSAMPADRSRITDHFAAAVAGFG